jgi:hypothetical protein
LSLKPKIRTEKLKVFVANFLCGLFTYRTQKTEQDDTSVFAASATLKAHVLSTVFEIKMDRGIAQLT